MSENRGAEQPTGQPAQPASDAGLPLDSPELRGHHTCLQSDRAEGAQAPPGDKYGVPVIPPGFIASLLGLPVRPWHTAVIILLTIVADVCLFNHPGGTGAAVLVLVTAIGLLAAAPDGWRTASPPLLIALILLAATMAWNCWWLAGLLAVTAALAFAIKLHRPEWSATELVWAAPWTAAAAPLRLFGHLVARLGYAAPSGELRPRRHTPLRVFLIPLAVTVLFLLIFIAANPVVERIADKVSDRLGEWLKDFFDFLSIARLFSWLGWLLVFAALIRPVVRSWFGDWLARRGEGIERPLEPAPERGDFAAAAITLLCVNVLFLLFNLLDTSYLYFKAALPEGISYSQYSHRGCEWLTIALMLSTAVIGLIFRKRMNFHPRGRLLRLLAYLWAAQNALLAVGALGRLKLYIDYNGMTHLRIVAIYGILLVAVGLGVVIWKVARARNFLWVVRRDLVALWVTLIVLAVTPADAICWRYNVSQAMAGNIRPLANLTVQHLSPEAYPALIPLLRHKEKWLSDGIAGYLGLRLDEMQSTPPQAWTEWQGARTWALTRIEGARSEIDRILPRYGWQAAQDELFRQVSPWVHSGVSEDYRVPPRDTDEGQDTPDRQRSSR